MSELKEQDGVDELDVKAPSEPAVKKTKKVVQMQDSVLTKLKGEIEEKQIIGGKSYHTGARAGIQRRILVATYQIRELLIDLSDRQNKKFRKHYDKHASTAEYISTLPFTLEGGKSNYRMIWAELKQLEADLVESAELVSIKIRKFGTKSKAIQARIQDELNTVSDDVITESDDYNIAI